MSFATCTEAITPPNSGQSKKGPAGLPGAERKEWLKKYGADQIPERVFSYISKSPLLPANHDGNFFLVTQFLPLQAFQAKPINAAESTKTPFISLVQLLPVDSSDVDAMN